MQIEHPLTAEQTRFAKAIIEALNKQRREYLVALGIAKEAEQITHGLQQALSQALGLIEREAGLPPAAAGYSVSADGTKLVGETADAPAPATNAIAVNGHAAEGMAHA